MSPAFNVGRHLACSAHYLHIVDTLETAYEYGLKIRPRASNDDSRAVRRDFDAYREEDFETLLENRRLLNFALKDDASSFALSPTSRCADARRCRISVLALCCHQHPQPERSRPQTQPQHRFFKRT
jgi:hypothetical protein